MPVPVGIPQRGSRGPAEAEPVPEQGEVEPVRGVQPQGDRGDVSADEGRPLLLHPRVPRRSPEPGRGVAAASMPRQPIRTAGGAFFWSSSRESERTHYIRIGGQVMAKKHYPFEGRGPEAEGEALQAHVCLERGAHSRARSFGSQTRGSSWQRTSSDWRHTSE